jgi:hypothetical protein
MPWAGCRKDAESCRGRQIAEANLKSTRFIFRICQRIQTKARAIPRKHFKYLLTSVRMICIRFGTVLYDENL